MDPHLGLWKLTTEVGRLKIEPSRICRQLAVASQYFDEEQDPDLYQSDKSDPHQSEKGDPEQDLQQSDADPQHYKIGHLKAGGNEKEGGSRRWQMILALDRGDRGLFAL